MRQPTLLLIAAFALVATAPAASSAATAKRGTFAGTLGAKLARGAHADIRAISRTDGTITAAATVKRTGAFSLTLPAGSYLVVGTVVTKAGKVTQVKSAVSLRAGQKRVGSNLKRKRTRRKARRTSARSAFVQELGQVSPGRVAAQIPNFTGNASGELGAITGGLNDLMITDVLDRAARCGAVLVEIERRADAIRELEFQQSPYVDPSTRLTRNFIISDVEVRGTLTEAPGGRATIDVRVVDLRSGEEHSRLSETFEPNDIFDVMERLSHQTADELCKLHDVYEVTLDVRGEGIFATHTSSGTLRATLRARGGTRERPVWRDSGPLAWQGVTFSSKIPPCVYIDPVVPGTSWSVTITAADDSIQVTWAPQGADAVTASVDCPKEGDGPDPPPIPGQPGPALLLTGPMSFTLPYAGGVQAISGGVSSGGDGFFNTGTITVKPSGVAR